MTSRKTWGALVLLAVLAALLYWKGSQTGQNETALADSSPRTQSNPVVLNPSATSAPKPAPVAAPANSSVPASTYSASPAVPENSSPLAELNQCLSTGLGLLRSNDLGLFTRAYLRPPKPGTVTGNSLPAKVSSDDQFSKGMLDSPNGPLTLQKTIAFFEAMQSMTPLFSDAGNQAIYKDIPTASGGKVDLVWILDNGRWYLKDGWPTAE